MRSLSFVTVASFALAVVACDDRPFVTAVDLPLQVIALQPSDGSVGVARDTAVTARFNLEVVPGTVTDGANFFLEDVTDPNAIKPVAAAIVYTPGSGDTPPTAVLTPQALLAYSGRYRITLTTGIARQKDEQQNIPEGHLLEQVTATFATLDPPPLRLTASEPGAGAMGVPLDSAIALSFSEPIRCSTL
ncbi:MAG: Ig-like domain-containing protein, partial [Deltaproteobacteria bacterium]|nr:Ig-like domain-containing protein [Deltaproteobacteria bacterium]